MENIQKYINVYNKGLISKMEALNCISKELEEAIFKEECKQFEKLIKFRELEKKATLMRL